MKSTSDPDHSLTADETWVETIRLVGQMVTLSFALTALMTLAYNIATL